MSDTRYNNEYILKRLEIMCEELKEFIRLDFKHYMTDELLAEAHVDLMEASRYIEWEMEDDKQSN